MFQDYQELKKINKIFKNSNILYWGVCRFDIIEPFLIKCRALNRLPKNAKTIFSAVFPYFCKVPQKNISRYAVPPDYHNIVMKMLLNAKNLLVKEFNNYKFEAFVDNSPIPEVRTAALSSLGCIGDHGLLINKAFGSFVFIGEIVTDLPLKHYENYSIKECLHCKACTKNCVGNALGNSRFIKDNCLSHVSQKKGVLSEHETNLILKGKSVWGCDICQECCPLNKNIKETYIQDFKSNLVPVINTGDYDNLTDRAFMWRPKSVIERNIGILNGNCEDNNYGK